MFTLFSVPKPFVGHTGLIQTNALASWSRLEIEVILIGDEEGTRSAARRFGFRHAGEEMLERNSSGTPLVDSIFRVGEALAPSEVVCYVNADIVLLSDIVTATAHLDAQLPHFLGTGRRWDVQLSELIDPQQDGYEGRMHTLAQTGRLHEPTGLDYFIFRKGLWPMIPPFSVGRSAWDNWLVWSAVQAGAHLVDCTEAVTAIHQSHGYEHLGGGKAEAFTGPEAARNLELTGGWDHIRTLDDATHRLRADGLVRRSLPWGRRVLRVGSAQISGLRALMTRGRRWSRRFR